MSNLLKYIFTLCLIIISLCIVYKLQFTPSVIEKQQAGAYLAVFQEFYPLDRVIRLQEERGTFYISVDLSNVQYGYPDVIKTQIENYINGSHAILLWDDMNDLVKSGLILTTVNGDPMIFEKGELFFYKDKSLTKTLLETDAVAWTGNLGAIGATYIVEKTIDVWTITSVTNTWIS